MNSFTEGFMVLFVALSRLFDLEGGKFVERVNKKTPAYAVLITILNLLKKWVPGVVCFRLSATRPAEQGGHAHRKQV